jgi:hypothetical protein
MFTVIGKLRPLTLTNALSSTSTKEPATIRDIDSETPTTLHKFVLFSKNFLRFDSSQHSCIFIGKLFCKQVSELLLNEHTIILGNYNQSQSQNIYS